MADSPTGVMIESEIQSGKEGPKSMVVYWHADCFLDDPPYRKIVRWMIDTWRTRFGVRIRHDPAEEKHEDFVVTELSLDERPLQVYWENSLGYVSIQSDDENLLREAAQTLKGLRPPQ